MTEENIKNLKTLYKQFKHSTNEVIKQQSAENLESLPCYQQNLSDMTKLKTFLQTLVNQKS